MVRNKDTEIKSNLIIDNVRIRPCLYESNHPNFADRAEKRRAWEEVCEAVVPRWSTMAAEDRFSAGKEVQKRWRSIRDSYTKAYRQGKCILPENCPQSSRKYIQHHQMSFLLTALQNKKARYSQEKCESSITDLSNSPLPAPADDVKDFVISDTAKMAMRGEIPVNCSDATIDNVTAVETQTPSFEIKMDTTTVKSEDHFEDDELFMNSLLPFFKKMSDSKRLLCRIEMLKIIHSALKQLSSEASAQTTITTDDRQREIKSESTLTMTTRSADGSRPVRKRRSDSPAPVAVIPPKKRGRGRPRKVLPAIIGDEQLKNPNIHRDPKAPNVPEKRKFPENYEEKKSTSNSKPQLKVVPIEVKKNPETEDSLNKETTVINMPTALFMKIFKLRYSSMTPEPNKPPIIDEIQAT